LLAVLVLFFSAAWVEYAPLTTSRPPPEEIPEVTQTGVKARLWQDPFTAVQRQRAEALAKPTKEICSEKVPSDVLQDMANDKDTKIIALGAMIQEASWASMEELQGRRQRYAVLAALNRLGYLPDDADSLKCLRIPRNGDDQNALIIPYELFTKTGPYGEKAALFWLNELAFDKTPLSWIRALFGLYGLYLPGDEKIRIVGPWASGTVKKLVDEAQHDFEQWSETGKEFFSRLVFFSASATAADKDLLRRLPVDSRDQPLPEFLDKKGISFERLTSTDDKLAKFVVEELMRRGLDSRRVKAGKTYVALISEWDTLYAESLPRTFKRALGVHEQCLANVEGCPILEYSYLRGLDGLLPGKGQADAARQRQNNDNKEPKKNGGAIERPEGDSQVDYLRRLTDRIAEQDRLFQEQGKELKAIGVFGNDIYDKLLVLKALRLRFPGKLVFTTDLDAAYLHPEEFKSETHNLIVASAFGLTLNPYLQGKISPFRDSYQTGTFLAAQVALSHDQFGESIEKPNKRIEVHNKIAEWFPEQGPRLFEIGRTEAVSLNDPGDGQSDPCTLVDCRSVHPTSNTWMGESTQYGNGIFRLTKLYTGLLLLAALLWLLLCLLWRDARRATSNIGRWLRHHPSTTFAGLAGLVALVVWMNYLAFFATSEEPFSWFNGVSMWPAELIRLATLLLTVLLFYRGWLLIRWNDFVVSKRFFPDTRRSAIFAFAPARQSLLDAMKEYWWELTQVKPDPQSPLLIWIEHIHPRGLWARFIRAVVPSAVFIAFGAIVLSRVGLPLERPYRGEAFGTLDLVILFPTLIAVQVLIFFVAEATSRCNRMAQQLKKTPNWLPATLAALGLTRGSAVEPGKRALREEHCDSIFDPLLDMQLIAERTHVLSGLIYYPFLALALFIASRTPLFDNWHTPWQLALLFILSFTIPVVCALRLRNNAEDLRRIALEKFSACMLAQKGSDDPKLVGQLEEAIKQVKSMDKGAFRPFTQQPWLKALFLPLGSWSGLTILEFLVRTTFL
ncbi:MAG TPA: hypothetical protein VLU73_05080, partial [Methylococcaceae bacterium]|nr:hypothetical protein [Methylococcaceae bacterium]